MQPAARFLQFAFALFRLFLHSVSILKLCVLMMAEKQESFLKLFCFYSANAASRRGLQNFKHQPMLPRRLFFLPCQLIFVRSQSFALALSFFLRVPCWLCSNCFLVFVGQKTDTCFLRLFYVRCCLSNQSKWLLQSLLHNKCFWCCCLCGK